MFDESGAQDIEVYGQDHSPWVQAVLLGLHEKGIVHRQRLVPTLGLFLDSGVRMPAARIDGDDWQLESAEILERVGFASVSREDMAEIAAAWTGVAHRVDSTSRFWHRFSLVRGAAANPVRRAIHHFLRSFAVLHFFVLIHFVRRFAGLPEPVSFATQFTPWEARLAKTDGPFLGGEDPDTLDLLLFGIIQCHCSNPVPPIDALQSDPGLERVRSWIGAMQQRFADYPSLYSGVYFEPHSPPPIRATPLEQAAFWLGVVTMIAAWPITLPLIVFRIRRGRTRPRAS